MVKQKKLVLRLFSTTTKNQSQQQNRHVISSFHLSKHDTQNDDKPTLDVKQTCDNIIITATSGRFDEDVIISLIDGNTIQFECSHTEKFQQNNPEGTEPQQGERGITSSQQLSLPFQASVNSILFELKSPSSFILNVAIPQNDLTPSTEQCHDIFIN